MSMKRTRPIRGKYFLTMPRIAIEGKVYEIKVKISQVIVTMVKDLPKRDLTDEEVDTGFPLQRAGEIERGSVDGDERPSGKTKERTDSTI